jgi:hypothetical protein
MTLARDLFWKIVSTEATFKGAEHHTRGTGEGNKERVLAIAAMARRLGRTEKGWKLSHGGKRQKQRGDNQALGQACRHEDCELLQTAGTKRWRWTRLAETVGVACLAFQDQKQDRSGCKTTLVL